MDTLRGDTAIYLVSLCDDKLAKPNPTEVHAHRKLIKTSMSILIMHLFLYFFLNRSECKRIFAFYFMFNYGYRCIFYWGGEIRFWIKFISMQWIKILKCNSMWSWCKCTYVIMCICMLWFLQVLSEQAIPPPFGSATNIAHCNIYV